MRGRRPRLATSRTPSPPPLHAVGDGAQDLPAGAQTPPVSFRECSPARPIKPPRAEVAAAAPVGATAAALAKAGVATPLAQQLCFNSAALPIAAPLSTIAAGMPGIARCLADCPKTEPTLSMDRGSTAAQVSPVSIQPPPGLPLPSGVQLLEPQPPHILGSPVCQVVLSAGSVGHPHCCGPACRYAKRKGGCRDGASCSSCHLCFWRRGAEKDRSLPTCPQEADKSEEHVSVGTKGHPVACGAPCKYVHRKGGCRDGASCPNCHECLWRREKTPESMDREGEMTTEPSIGFFGDSGKTLQSLIEVLLTN